LVRIFHLHILQETFSLGLVHWTCSSFELRTGRRTWSAVANWLFNYLFLFNYIPTIKHTRAALSCARRPVWKGIQSSPISFEKHFLLFLSCV
jgi:hypothetical protein